MSKKIPEEIDLNCDALPVDRENEDNDVNDDEPASGAGTSSTKTLTERTVDGVGVFGKDNESAGGIDELGEESKMESVKHKGIDLEADIGSLGEEVDGKVSARFSSGGDSLMEVDGGSRGRGDGESVSIEDKKPVVAEQIAMRSSGGVAEDLNVSVCPSEDTLIEGNSVRIQLSLFADNTIQSGIAHDLGSDDAKPLSSGLGPGNSLPYGEQNVSSKEGSSGRLEGRDMEIDTPDDTNERNLITAIQDKGDRVIQNAEKGSNLLNDAVDLNSCTSTDEDVSDDADAKPEKPEEPEFCVSDLVWGKVRSHPWWPGQIFDRSAATAKAKKYFKKDCYLIAYFGDQTFAWNEASRIKPFRPHFSHMEKQNNMEEFHYAIDCALDEVSRRVEFGLACSCICKEAYAEVQAQIIVNAGIREESSRKDGGDRFSGVASFDPFELVERIKALAQSPSYSEVDRLQFITSQAQLLAFHRWKGYSQLPEFQNLCGLLETDVEIPLSEEVKKHCELIGGDVPSVEVDKQVLSEREKSESQDGSSQKQKKIPGDAKVSNKKEKSLSELIAERRLNMQNGKGKLTKKAGDKLISSSPAKKLKVVESVRDDSALKQNRSNASTGSVDKSLQSKQTFRVGASILRVASQLNGSSSTVSTPVLKHGDGTTKKKSAVNNESKGKNSSGKSPGKTAFQTNMSSADEMLSQLCLAATDPLKGYSFLSSMVFFFMELRNSIAMDLNSSEMSEQSSEQGTDGEIGEKSTRFEVTGKSELTSIKDTCCSDRIIQCLPEEQLAVDNHNQTTEVSPDTPSEKGFSVIESQPAAQASPNLDSEQKCTVTDENLGMEAEKRIEYSDESYTEDLYPTALILNFSDLESVPSVEDLNKIFSRYGPLVAPGAEVLKKSVRARVVFKRHADAETAFSSSGKYSIFGPSLVSYRLKRLASALPRSSPVATKQSRTDETCGDGSTT
ncbi:hypothetical protein QUC31_011173 [Theobroma cacao]|uniref:Tudor/PWWP/MBT superfamily protein, putative isoform 1 n=1 Tax=Theobroma cacao TaxID=3641 RepID=A0A061ERW0_THECC|nr:Tudor/PWWP/MBT superfamily protein, putative isoform 1 [Theobroma cacao]EOY07750.1 Tudor/PWWP/MBT superfamily protein, putative isoform 1 [Theobroma cacao]EOY07751.1 Tudor/PWWP/MBT superfamily protein, putative isoform 1 [Theobroma cacao]